MKVTECGTQRPLESEDVKPGQIWKGKSDSKFYAVVVNWVKSSDRNSLALYCPNQDTMYTLPGSMEHYYTLQPRGTCIQLVST